MPLGTDQRAQATDDAVGAGHATKTDTINRLALVSLNNDGTLKASSYMPHGQCYLDLSGGNLRLLPRNGNNVLVKDADGWFIRQVPNAGITLGTGGLVVDTNYNIYLYDSAGTLTLEASTTASALDADTGVRIKSGDATRTLVGKARTDNPLAWVDSGAKRYVLSYFQRRGKISVGALTADRTTASTSFVEVNSEIRANYLTWGDEVVVHSATGSVDHDTGTTGRVQTSLGVDGATSLGPVVTMTVPTASRAYHMSVEAHSVEAEGNHYTTLIGRTNAGNATWFGTDATTSSICRLEVVVMG